MSLAVALAMADPITECEDAVHMGAPTEQACRPLAPPRDRLWGADNGLPADCGAARAAGASFTPKTYELPPIMLGGLLRRFDALVAACRHPTPLPKPSDRKTLPRLWDGAEDPTSFPRW